MQRATIITKILSLTGLASVFENYSASSDTPALHRFNLIYGFNGSGKTTLSRVFSSLAINQLHPKLPTTGTFKLRLNDQRTLDSKTLTGEFINRVLVFNSDFVGANLHWKEGSAEPVFYLGKTQTSAAREIEEKSPTLEKLRSRLAQATDLSKKADQVLEQFKREKAKLIAEQLGLGRAYIATHLDKDFSRSSYGPGALLREQQRQSLLSLIAQKAPLPKKSSLPDIGVAADSILPGIGATLTTTPGKVTLAELRDNPELLSWVRDGLQYHSSQQLKTCTFCGEPLSPTRLEELQHSIDSGIDKLLRDIGQRNEEADHLLDRINAVQIAIPSENDIISDLRQTFTESAGKLSATCGATITSLESLKNLLSQKRRNPPKIIDGEKALEVAADHLRNLRSEFKKINDIIGRHNRSHDRFEQRRESARESLKCHYLAESEKEYRKLQNQAAKANRNRQRLSAEVRRLELELEGLRQRLRDHSPAADFINQRVQDYLGHSEIEIQAIDSGYQFMRHGEPFEGSLSEGEKTAIALCYFLCSIEAEGRRIEDCIVVVDDPISSLDSKALNYAFCTLRASLRDAAQVILLTHNLNFMNETKKWLKRKAAGTTPSATLLFLDLTQNSKGHRSSEIRALPKFIREYDSEYEFLFHLLLEFQKDPLAEHGHFYLIPNVLRKILEVFMSFEFPGSSGLGSKLVQALSDYPDLDPGRVHALNRLLQAESHSDSLENLVTLSSLTIEEAKVAGESLCYFMGHINASHYERMCKLCQA